MVTTADFVHHKGVEYNIPIKAEHNSGLMMLVTAQLLAQLIIASKQLGQPGDTCNPCSLLPVHHDFPYVSSSGGHAFPLVSPMACTPGLATS